MHVVFRLSVVATVAAISACTSCDAVVVQPLKDAGFAVDSGVGLDAGGTDAGTDAGVDAGDGDAGVVVDAGIVDAGVVDPCDLAASTGIFSHSEIVHGASVRIAEVSPSSGGLSVVRAYYLRDDANAFLITSSRGTASYQLDGVVPNVVLNGLANLDLIWRLGPVVPAVIFQHLHPPFTSTLNRVVLDHEHIGFTVTTDVEEATQQSVLIDAQGEAARGAVFNGSGLPGVGLGSPRLLPNGDMVLVGEAIQTSSVVVDGVEHAITEGASDRDAFFARSTSDGRFVETTFRNPLGDDAVVATHIVDDDLVVAGILHRGPLQFEQFEATTPMSHVLAGVDAAGAVQWHIKVARTSPDLSLPIDMHFFGRQGEETCALFTRINGQISLDDGVQEPILLGQVDGEEFNGVIACFSRDGLLTTARLIAESWVADRLGNTEAVAHTSNGTTWLLIGFVGDVRLSDGQRFVSAGGTNTLALEFDEQLEIVSVSRMIAPGDVWPRSFTTDGERLIALLSTRSCLRATQWSMPQPEANVEHLLVLEMPSLQTGNIRHDR